jgi:hypothetical protein
MFKIDAQMKENADDIATAVSSIETITTTATTALTTAQSAETTANSANTTAQSASTTAGNAQSTANSALATATSAQTTANTALTDSATAQTTANQVATNLSDFVDYMTFTQFDNIPVSDITFTNCTATGSGIYVATNDDGTIGKIYGRIGVTGTNSSAPSFSFPSKLRPSANINITTIGVVITNPGANSRQDFVDLSIDTNGVVTITSNFAGGVISGGTHRFGIFPCVLFMSDFGDQPE